MGDVGKIDICYNTIAIRVQKALQKSDMGEYC